MSAALTTRTRLAHPSSSVHTDRCRAVSRRSCVVVRAQISEQELASRRAVLGLFASVGALSQVAPSEAAYGDAARVFAGKVTNKTGFVPYIGEGYALLIPSRWNPSKEVDFPGVTLRYEDNADAVNNLIVIKKPAAKASLSEYGDPEKFLGEVSYLLGEQTYSGSTASEGGFQPNKVSAASLLDVSSVTDKNNKQYYAYELLVRTADGDEGGRHQLIKAAIDNGTLYILKIQVGDKRWFKGVNRDALGCLDSFSVA